MKATKFWYRKHRWQLVTRIMARDGQNCMICGEQLDRRIRNETSPHYITFDHILPRSLGGGDELANKRLAHQRCNQDRGNDPITPADEVAA